VSKEPHTKNSIPAAVAVWEAWLRLIFWAAREALGVILLMALTAYVVVALVEGRLPDELLNHPAWELPGW
jgi:hypothetical protein